MMADPALLNLIIAILGIFVGIGTAKLYHLTTTADVNQALAEAERVIAIVTRDNELLQYQVEQLRAGQDRLAKVRLDEEDEAGEQ